MSRKTVSIIAIALLALLALPYAVAGTARGVANQAGWGHCDRGASADLTEASVRERMSLGATFVLSRVDATDEQTAAIDAILDELAPEAFALKVDGTELRTEIKDALIEGDVDPVALEAFRLEGLAHADEASKLMVEAFVQLAEVLTPEQRAELAAEATRMHERWSK